jgi:peptide-methionine (S)-S-oxide reductase
VEVDFNSRVTSYTELLDIFWQSHSATTAWCRQYMSAIWYHSDVQRQLAEQSKQRQQQIKKHRVVTLIAPASRFYLAEDYHQKYFLQGETTIFRLLKLDPHDARGLADSRAATRLNAYVAGYNNLENLKAEIHTFGLTDSTRKELLSLLELQQRRKLEACRM